MKPMSVEVLEFLALYRNFSESFDLQGDELGDCFALVHRGIIQEKTTKAGGQKCQIIAL